MEVPTLKGLELNSKVSAATITKASEAPKIIQCKSKKSTPTNKCSMLSFLALASMA